MTTTTKYRADIDGLRAVAVLAVIGFHAFPSRLPGGFIGVDMFFVISGYLIGGIIYAGCRAGTFSCADFYARRVRRIFPALIAAVALCLAYGWLVLLPAEYEQLGGHVAAGTVFLQNVAFWQESGYFDKTTSLKPLAHLWSLAVEEQIYLVFPPLVLFVWWMRWPMAAVLASLLAASFVANVVMAGRSAAADFFLTPFRAWEFLAGGILAWLHDRRGQPSEGSWLGEAASWSGALLLAAGMAWITDQEPYPGWRAAVPVVGTMLMIAAGPSASLNRRVMSLAPLVWIGLISYPLYLFHWPLISFVHIVKGAEPDPTLIVAAVALSLVLAVATYYGLERRIRYSRWRWTVPLLLAGFVILGGLGVGIWRGAIPPRPLSKDMQQVNDAIRDVRHAFPDFRHKRVQGINHLTIGGAGPQTLFVGDSHMAMYAPRIHDLLVGNTQAARGGILIWCGGACPLPRVQRSDKRSAQNLMAVVEEELRTNQAIDRVVIAAAWPMYFLTGNTRFSIDQASLGTPEGRRMALAEFGAMISRLVGSGKQVSVVLAVPMGPEVDPSKMYPRSFLGIGAVRTPPLTVEAFLEKHGEAIRQLAAVAKANGATVIDPIPSLSRKGVCIDTNDDGPIRLDASHFRAKFVRENITYLDGTMAADAGEPR